MKLNKRLEDQVQSASRGKWKNLSDEEGDEESDLSDGLYHVGWTWSWSTAATWTTF